MYSTLCGGTKDLQLVLQKCVLVMRITKACGAPVIGSSRLPDLMGIAAADMPKLRTYSMRANSHLQSSQSCIDDVSVSRQSAFWT